MPLDRKQGLSAQNGWLFSGQRGLASVFFCVFLWCVSTYADAQVANSVQLYSDRIVVIVGDSVITDHEVGEELAVITKRLQGQGLELPNGADLRRQVIERLILRRILVDYADKTGIRVTDGEIGKIFSELALSRGITGADLIRALETEQGLNFDKIRNGFIDELKIEKLRQRELDQSISVSEAEIDSILEGKNRKESEIEEYQLAHILVRIPSETDQAQPSRAKEKIQEALNRLKKGVDFRAVAAELSEATDALDGGILGWRSKVNLPQLFLSQLERMRIDSHSDIFQSPNGYHILYLFDKRGAREILVQQTLVAHILLRVDEYSDEEAVQRRALAIRQRVVRGEEDFGELAKRTSDDISSGKGGLIGWVGPGETVPEFERAMNALEVGESSDPIRTQFGFHIIKVLDRKEENLSDERRRAAALQQIRRKKMELNFEEWVSELRDKTFIEYRTLEF